MPVPRKRSCAQCRRAKARCSLTAPSCSRCISRSLNCDYAATLSQWSDLGSNAWEGVIVQEESQSGGSGLLNPADFDVPGGNATELDMDFFDVEDIPAIQWDSQVQSNIHRQVSRKSPFTLEGFDPFVQNLNDSSALPWIEYGFTPNLPTIEAQGSRSRRQSPFYMRDNASKETYLTELSKKLFMTDFNAPPWPSPKTIPKKMHNLLSRRPIDQIGSMLTANYLFSTIQTYPEMLSTSNFPPFVHRYFADLSSDLPEPLANCMAFLSMFRSKTAASERFVAKTLFIEAQRLHNEFHIFDEWMKLAAIQALTVYIVLIASEKDRCRTLSAVLVLAVGEIAAVMHHWNAVTENESDGNIDWKEWRFIESKRRTMILLWLLQMLLDMDIGIPASPSCRKLDEIPMPSSRKLWEASTKVEWQSYYKFSISSRKSGRMLKIGDLRAAKDSSPTVMDKALVEDLQCWSSNADSFGGLIMMIIC